MEIEDLKNNPEALKQLIGLLSSLLPKDSDVDTQPTETKPKKTRKKKTEITTQSTNNKRKFNRKEEHSNKFLSMVEKNMFKEDIAIDRLLSKYPPTERTRSSSKINVQCRVCGKKDTIHPSMLCESVDRYKCNNCSRSAG